MSTDVKIDLWERKLLDLGLRNNLISLKSGKKMIPLFTRSTAELEDALNDGKDFIIRSRSEEEGIETGEYDFEAMADISAIEEQVSNAFAKKILISSLTPAELEDRQKALYRAAKSSLEENGANTLFLALGLLRWYEKDKPETPRYAPIILIPVEMVRKSAAQGYLIRLRDDDVQFNVTIMERIKQDFEVRTDAFDVLPEDEHGIDIAKVYETMRGVIDGFKGWEIIDTAHLGIFSFTQFVMWNDLKNHREELSQNKIVDSLLQGRVTWECNAMVPEDKVDENGVFLPMSADASQLYAIRAASQGESFVLHGPPGTGKSQTITSMIANLLADGKSVLFAAEKKAALEVVYNRLSKIGIAPFCLELHSNKARKRDVLEQLRIVSEIASSGSSDEYKRKADEIAARRRELDGYGAELHAVRDSGFSLFELINTYESNTGAPDIPAFPEGFRAGFVPGQSDKIESEIEQMVSAAREIGSPSTDPLKAITATEYSQQMRNELPSCVSEYEAALTGLSEAYRAVGTVIGGEGVRSDNDPYEKVDHDYYISVIMNKWYDYPVAWANAGDVPSYLNGMRDMCAHFANAGELRGRISANWKDGFFEQDANLLLNKYKEAELKWALAKTMDINRIYKLVKSSDKTGKGKAILKESLELLVAYNTELGMASSAVTVYQPGLGSLFAGEATDWGHISAMADAAIADAVQLRNLTGSDSLLGSIAARPEARSLYENMIASHERTVRAEQKMNEMLGITATATLADRLGMCRALRTNSDGIRGRIAYNRQAAVCRSLGVGNVVDSYENGVDGELLIPAFRKAYSRMLASEIIDSSTVLSSFSGAAFNGRIEQFRRLDDELMQLTRQEIYLRLAARIPDFSREAGTSSELGIMKKAIRSGGRGMSIRRLFSEIPNILMRLCPCMLMSPISVAQYLGPGGITFDTVIFDEASQLPTCKAVGVLARGNNAVIVGDPKQMPPTSFFQSDYLDEEHIDDEDLESILDDCLALNMPQTHLVWHYRSRHESLIDFSNKCFYENRLYTFPSVNDLARQVTLQKIDGIFDRGRTRTNRIEAEAVVAEIRRIHADPATAGRSVGVVTFNINQQNLIDDLVSEACKDVPDFEQWAYSSEEPIFIKNLENVQGDERDYILFSVGYGTDETGNIYMNFGPLNLDGGWRRLNVAVTRARYAMKVFSSMTPEQLRITDSTSEGVAALKRFLEYADGRAAWDAGLESGYADGTSSPIIDREARFTGIADSICSRLPSLGYKTERRVGKSGFKIDIGIVDPEDPERYKLGILLDGGSYRTAKTTRDRELSQLSVLEGLGWRLMRVWSVDWWENPDHEIDRIVEELNREPEPPEPEKAESETSEAEAGGESAEPDKGGEPRQTENEADLQEHEVGTESPVPEAGTESPAAEAVGDSSNSETVTAPPAPETGGVTEPEAGTGSDLLKPEKASESLGLGEDCEKYIKADLGDMQMTSDEFYSPLTTPRLIAAARLIVDTEAPVSFDLLTQRLLGACGLKRCTDKARQRVAYICNSAAFDYTEHDGNTFYWSPAITPDNYSGFRVPGCLEDRRDVADITVQEAANAVAYIVTTQIGLPAADAAKETARLFGFARGCGTDLFERAVTYAVNRGLVKEGAGGKLIAV